MIYDGLKIVPLIVTIVTLWCEQGHGGRQADCRKGTLRTGARSALCWREGGRRRGTGMKV